MRRTRLAVPAALACAVALLLLSSPAGQPEPALAAAFRVCPDGPPLCAFTTIQAAVSGAFDGAEIQVAQGTYTENVHITRSVTLLGGFNSDFTVRNPKVYPTTVNGNRAGSVFHVEGQVSPTIDGFVITGGDATGFLGWGGGVYIDGDWGDNEQSRTVLSNNVITGNIACTTASCQGYGGGVMVYSADVTLDGNTIISNVARTAVAGDNIGGHGGGVAIWGTSQATLTANTILNNIAAISTTSPFGAGEGGGIWAADSARITAFGNDIRGNTAAAKGEGYGGGAYAGGDLFANTISGNAASGEGPGYGGGVYANYLPRMEGNIIADNVASRNGDGTGGGVYAQQLFSARGNILSGNVASRGGGVYLGPSAHTEFVQNTVAGNSAVGDNLGDGGGGIMSVDGHGRIADNTITANGATVFGGGLLVGNGLGHDVTDNVIAGNDAGFGGGVFVYSSTSTLARNLVQDNTGLHAGGGLVLAFGASSALDANRVVGNTSVGSGGGLYIAVASAPVTMTNQVIARNEAAGQGGGLIVDGSSRVRLYHNTLVDNVLGAAVEGISVVESSRVTLTNNIIMGHGRGISLATSSTIALSHNDYWKNTVDVAGGSTGTGAMFVDPAFVNAADDYHLSLDSPLIDVGDPHLGVAADMDGDPRPRGAGVDVGADEAYLSIGYVSKECDKSPTGSDTDPFCTVTRAISETGSGGRVIVDRGVYTESITLTRSIALMGGYRYDPDAILKWQRNVSAYASILDGSHLGTVVTIMGDRVQATVDGFHIRHGEATGPGGNGGGIAVYDGAGAVIRQNSIYSNHAGNGGGGLMVSSDGLAPSIVERNRIWDNTADGVFPYPGALDSLSPQQTPEPGGGALLMGGPITVTNNLFYSNTSALDGDGLAMLPFEGTVFAYHNTVVDNGGAGGTGMLLGWGSDSILAFDNLIVGHVVGITVSSGAHGAWGANGFHDNADNYTPGALTLGNDVAGDPLFADRSGRDYHIGYASPMAGAGLNFGVSTDHAGSARPVPAGTAPDIGAYEVSQRRLWLPLVSRSAP